MQAPPLGGVALNGLPGGPVTNEAGDYVGSVQPGWTGTVSPSKLGYSFEPLSRAYTNVLTPIVGEDYAAYSGGSLSISTGSVPDGRSGSFYDFTIYAQGGTPPYTWTVVSGRLPNGLTLDSGGRLSGTPTEDGEYPWTVRVVDSSSPPIFATQSFSFFLNPNHQGTWTTTYPLGGGHLSRDRFGPAKPGNGLRAAQHEGHL